MAANRTSWTLTLSTGVAHLVKAGTDMWTNTQLGRDDPSLFTSGMLTDIRKCDLTDIPFLLSLWVNREAVK